MLHMPMLEHMSTIFSMKSKWGEHAWFWWGSGGKNMGTMDWRQFVAIWKCGYSFRWLWWAILVDVIR